MEKGSVAQKTSIAFLHPIPIPSPKLLFAKTCKKCPYGLGMPFLLTYSGFFYVSSGTNFSSSARLSFDE